MDEKKMMELIEEMSSKEKKGELFEIPIDLLSSVNDNKYSPEETASKLQECFELLNVENDFQEGQLVSWKKGLKNRRRPKYDEPAIVIKVLEQPVFSEETRSGSPYFREPLDIILGVLVNEQLEIFYYDKRRLAHFKVDISAE